MGIGIKYWFISSSGVCEHVGDWLTGDKDKSVIKVSRYHRFRYQNAILEPDDDHDDLLLGRYCPFARDRVPFYANR
jgi:hypothetical protein